MDRAGFWRTSCQAAPGARPTVAFIERTADRVKVQIDNVRVRNWLAALASKTVARENARARLTQNTRAYAHARALAYAVR
jgi:hypothetical protein